MKRGHLLISGKINATVLCDKNIKICIFIAIKDFFKIKRQEIMKTDNMKKHVYRNQYILKITSINETNFRLHTG